MSESFSVKPELARSVASEADEVSSPFTGVASALARASTESGDVITHGDGESLRQSISEVQQSIEATAKFLTQNAELLREAVTAFEKSDER